MIKLTPVMQKYILHWGEMGQKWGINRTVAQIHALLYLSPKPINSEDIAEALSVARSNVSNSLKELQSWRIVKVVHIYGDRRDYYESLKDIWQMFRIILEERKKREIDPTLETVQSCVEEASSADQYTKQRMEEMLNFLNTMSGAYEEFKTMPTETILKLLKLGGKVRKLLGVT